MLLTTLDIVVKASISLTAAAIVALALRRSSAATRHFVWTLGLAGALAAPALSFALPHWDVPIVTIAAPQSEAPAQLPATRDSALAPTGVPAPHHTAPGGRAAVENRSNGPAVNAAPATRGVSLPLVLLLVWAAGAALLMGRVLLGVAAVRWFSRQTARTTDAAWLPLARALAADLGLSRVRFLQTRTASMPMVWGILHPSVLMPVTAHDWPVDRLRIVLLHELAHVKRRDCLTHLFAQMACATYWFNPLAWVAVRHLRIERERACDDLVIAAGTRGPDYADQLIDIARVMRAGRFPAVMAGASLAMAHRSQLEGRLMAILDPTVPRRTLGRRRATLATILCTVFVLPLAAVRPWAQEPAAAQAVPAVAPLPSVDVAATLRPAVPAAAVSVAQGTATLQSAQTAVAIHAATTIAPAIVDQVVGGIAGGVTEGVGSGIARGISGGVASGVSGGVASGVSGGVVSGVSGGIAAAMVKAQEPRPKVSDDPDEQDEPRAARNSRAVDALILALNDTDKEVRETAMAALARSHDPRAFDPLMTSLSDSSDDVREQAAFGLGQLRDARAVDALSAALMKDAKANVREQAAFALGQIRSPKAVDALTAALRDSGDDVREQAVFALGQIRDERAVDPLIAALKDQSADVREQAAFALGQLRSAKAIEALVVALKDSNASVREQVAFALGQLRDPRAVDGLTIALKDPSASVRRQAAFALGQIR